MQQIKATEADAVFIGGLICENGAPADQGQGRGARPERRRGQADHAGRVRDAGTIDGAGSAVRAGACTCRSPASRPTSSRAQARTFVDGLQAVAERRRRSTRTPSTAARPPQVMLDAIAARRLPRDVISKMFATKVTDGLLGSFTFNANGDPRREPVHRIDVDKARTSSTTDKVIAPTDQPRSQAAVDRAVRVRRQGAPMSTIDLPHTVAAGARGAPRASAERFSTTVAVVLLSARRRLARRQLRQGADGVHHRRADRAHARHDLRPRRPRLHARLRHPPADQLRPRRRVRAVGALSRARSPSAIFGLDGTPVVGR